MSKILSHHDEVTAVVERTINLLATHFPQYRLTCLLHLKGSGQVAIVSTESTGEAENMVKEIGNQLEILKR